MERIRLWIQTLSLAALALLATLHFLAPAHAQGTPVCQVINSKK